MDSFSFALYSLIKSGRNTHRAAEIISAPKVYGFDTGFVCYYRGWQQLRQDDPGPLWEHFVLNEIMARRQSMEIGYWRDKHGHEIDFIVAGRKGAPLAVDCKWSASGNVVAAQDVDRSYSKTYGDIEIRFESLRTLAERVDGHGV